MGEWSRFSNGQVLHHHRERDCFGAWCAIHRPSVHPLSTAELSWRSDRGLLERMCEHGIGHPDPDDLRSKQVLMSEAEYTSHAFGVHGCDGCCQPKSEGTEDGTSS